jgi:hypothetical protein
MTSSAVTTLRNSAIGLFAACRLALARILAKVSIVVPYFAMCAMPAPPKYRNASGTSVRPTSASVSASNRSNGVGRSLKWVPSAPGAICSNPSASTQSAAPPSTACRARNSAVEPVEQLLLTLTTGMPVIPTS